MNLIVHAPLSEPPTESLCFRYVLSCAKVNCEMDILLECEGNTRDLYWKFLSPRGMFDFISDITYPFEEKGLRLDTKRRASHATIVAKYIRLENQIQIIKDISNYASSGLTPGIVS